MKCAIYRRVSTDIQAEQGFSLEAQKIRLEAYAQSQGWEVSEDYIDDGYSAKNMNRPQLQQMLRDMRKGKFEIILVYKLDRLCRSIRDLNDMIEEFEEYNVKFKSSTEVLDTTTATGRLFINLIGTLAQWEREQTAERVVETMYKRAEQGMWNGGVVPFGYKYKNKKLVKHDEEAIIVERVFNLATTHGYNSICTTLNKEGIKTQHGKSWRPKTLSNMIRNPIYCGYITYGKKSAKEIIKSKINDIDFEPIISEELFNEVQFSLSYRKEHAPKPRNKRFHHFSTILVCPNCGSKMTGVTRKFSDKEYRYYRCIHKDRGECDLNHIREELIDDAFASSLSIFINDIEVKDNDETHKKEDIERELKLIKKKKERVKELYTELLMIDKKEFTEKMNKLIEDEEILYNNLQNESKVESKELIIEVLRNLKENWNLFSNEAKSKALRSIFKSIHFKVTEKPKCGKFGSRGRVEITNFEMR